MASSAQILANQANAIQSTGPKTEEGKKKSSRNALRHGLTAHTALMPDEDLQAYQALASAFEAQFQPANAFEAQIVARLIDLRWRLHRCCALENGLFALGQGESAAGANGSGAQTQAAMTPVGVLRAEDQAVRTLGMHEHRLARMFAAELAQLESFQNARRALARKELHEAATILNHKQTQKQSWDPSENGFVFSLPEVASYLSREKTLQYALRANHDPADRSHRLW